jgi:ATP-dependent Clp protease protease subunit
VNINSPGGDLFEGIAIYNLLRDHAGKVTTRVVGLAASSASVIAMAGDNIQIARAGFEMIHNVWVFTMGNRNDLRAAADQLEPFDDALADVYASRSGMDKAKVAKLMDKETWFSGAQAIESGFADELHAADQIEETEGGDDAPAAALRRADLALAKSGMPRSERRALLKQLRATSSAEPAPTPSAGEGVQSFVALCEQLAATCG